MNQCSHRPPMLARAAEAFMAVTLCAMVIAVFSNVVLRYAFGTGFVIYEELSRLLFVWLVCVGTIIAAYEKKHLAFTLVIDRLSPKWAHAFLVISTVTGFVLLAMVAKGAWDQVLAGLNSFSPVMGYPLALGAAAILMMAVVMMILIVQQAWDGLHSSKQGA